MDAQIETILRKTAAYVEITQTAIDRNNERRELFMKRAAEVADKLASKGIIPAGSVKAFNEKVSANETEVWSLVERLVDALPSDSMGERATEKLASQGKVTDPFERWILFGSPRAESRASGMTLE
jgi:hypothetical protein